MEHLNFNYKASNKKEIIKHILYENAIFDPKDIFSDKTDDECCSVSMITPSQMVSVTFEYSNSPDGHAVMACFLTDLIYPNNSKGSYLGQKIYIVERADNIFITCSKDGVIIILPEKNAMTQTQYNLFYNYINELKKSDYAQSGILNSIYLAGDKSDLYTQLQDIDKKLEKLKINIVDKNLERQENSISELDFSDCTTSDELIQGAEIYANQLLEIQKESLNNLNNATSTDSQGR